ncbi:MAG: sodium:glutamate symporter [Lentisphaerae bacterium]|nr:sodium:glutamate symporter [Lentisphaerota bacterium]
MLAVVVFCGLSLLLVAGKIIRSYFSFFQKLYLPSSVIGGLLGLVLISVFHNYIPAEWITTIKKLPGFLINVIFATLFLGLATPRFKEIFRIALPQLCLGQILSWGQYVIGLGVTGLVLCKLFDVPAAFGNLLEIGFQGGHGTVGGMSQSFETYNWSEGIALGYTVATGGMIIGIIVGMMLVNWALKNGFVKSVRTFAQRSQLERIGVYRKLKQPSAGRQTVLSDSIDSLALHLALVGVSILIGFGILKGLQALEVALLPDCKTRIFIGFPLFPLCMIGGVMLQIFMQKRRLSRLVDHDQMQRISGAALDYLVVSAVATIQLSVVVKNWLPLLIIIALGALFCVAMVVWLAPRLFKEDWFERAIADFGQATGVTATGLMLLRTVDPDNKTSAASSFGYKQLIHEPFMGGGIWTALALTLVFTIGWLPVWIFCIVMLIFWGVIALVIIRKNR